MELIEHNFNNIIGYDTIKKTLIQSYKSNKIPGVWIFSGTKGIGKYTLARNYASILLNVELEQLENHPDYYQLQSEDNISVDDIRSLHKFTERSSAFDGKRVVIIDCLDNLSINAANSLLKKLEEPGNNLLFILIYHQSSKMLDTIKSRSIELKFPNLTKEIAENYVSKNYPKLSAQEAGIICYFADNNIGKIKHLLEQDFLSIHKQFCDIISSKDSYQKILSFASSKIITADIFFLLYKKALGLMTYDKITENFKNFLFYEFNSQHNLDIITKNQLILWNKLLEQEKLVDSLYLPLDKIIIDLLYNLIQGLHNGKILYHNPDLLC